MNKLDMAHEWAIETMRKDGFQKYYMQETVRLGWEYADAMQAEADKRVVKLPDVFFDAKQNEEWQPNWSQAPEWAKYFAMDEDGEFYYFEQSPSMASCSWQPQSQGEVGETFNHSYKGNWKDSLRKRPQ